MNVIRESETAETSDCEFTSISKAGSNPAPSNWFLGVLLGMVEPGPQEGGVA